MEESLSTRFDPWEDPYQTMQNVKNAPNSDAAVKALIESMDEVKKKYENEFGTVTTLSGQKENYQYAHFYQSTVAKDLIKSGMVATLSNSWMNAKRGELDIHPDGFVSKTELFAARRDNRSRVSNAFLDHLIQNYDSLAKHPNGIALAGRENLAPHSVPSYEQWKNPGISQWPMRIEPKQPTYNPLALAQAERDVARDTALEVRKGDSYWTLAARNMGLSPKDKAGAGEIDVEMRRLQELNGNRALHPGDRIAVYDAGDITALAKERLDAQRRDLRQRLRI
jgi:hypothetical protein